jgi:hypothetical protein
MPRFRPHFFPSTKVSEWASGVITANPGIIPTYAGYFAGGDHGVTTVDRFLFADDSRTTLSTGLSQGVRIGAGIGNAGVAGYMCGGNTSGAPDVRWDHIDKFLFIDDTRSTLDDTLSSTVDGCAGMSNSGTAGYVAGGYDGDAASYTSRVDKILFSSDSKSTISATLATATGSVPAGLSNSGTAGYIGGGHDGSGTDVIDKLTFSGETIATLSAVLSIARWSMTGVSNSGTAGYAAGGYDPGENWGTVDKLLFSNDTVSTLNATLTNDVYAQGGMANSGTAGYIGGGYESGVGDTAVLNKLTFSGETIAALSTGLSSARYNATGFANSEALI